MNRSPERVVVCDDTTSQCTSCAEPLDGKGESWWWCSEECFYEWQRTRWCWTG
jgi:hypothetical protein